MDNLFSMDVGDTRDELSEEFCSVAFFEITMSEDMVEEFTAGSVF